MFTPQFPMNNDFVNFIYEAREFLECLIDDMAMLIDMTADFVSRIPSYLFWLPDSVKLLFVAGFTVVVVYKVLGREG